MDDAITASEFHASEGVEDWRVLGEGAFVFYPTRSFAESARLVAALGAIDGVGEHPPDVDVRHAGVTVSLITGSDDYRGMSRRDLDMARRVSSVARDLGLSADPSAVQTFLIVPGAPDIADVVPFWRAVLGYEPRPDSPERGSGRSAHTRPVLLVRVDGGTARRWRWRDPRRRLDPDRAGGGARRRGARGRRQDGPRRLRADLVDARRCGGQRGGYQHGRGPRLTLAVPSGIEAVVIQAQMSAGVLGPEPQTLDVRCFVVPTASGIVLIDVALPGTAGAIESTLDRIGARWSDVTDIVLTHSHFDHVGGLAEAAAQSPQARLWAGALDAADISAGTGIAIGSVVDGDRVGDLGILDTPGHTPGHISLHHEAGSLVVVGDLVGSVDGALSFGPPQFTADPTRSRRSLARVAGMQVDRLLFSHGAEVGDPIASVLAVLEAPEPSG